MTPSEGEKWYVKLPYKTIVETVTVGRVTSKTVLLLWPVQHLGGLPTAERYKIDDIEFIEMVETEPKKSPR